MTAEEFIDTYPDASNLVEYVMKRPSLGFRIWDNGTVDLTLPENTNLKQFIAGFSCPACKSAIETALTPSASADTKGTFATCIGCNIRYFIHNKVKFGGTT